MRPTDSCERVCARLRVCACSGFVPGTCLFPGTRLSISDLVVRLSIDVWHTPPSPPRCRVVVGEQPYLVVPKPLADVRASTTTLVPRLRLCSYDVRDEARYGTRPVYYSSVLLLRLLRRYTSNDDNDSIQNPLLPSPPKTASLLLFPIHPHPFPFPPTTSFGLLRKGRSEANGSVTQQFSTFCELAIALVGGRTGQPRSTSTRLPSQPCLLSTRGMIPTSFMGGFNLLNSLSDSCLFRFVFLARIPTATPPTRPPRAKPPRQRAASKSRDSAESTARLDCQRRTKSDARTPPERTPTTIPDASDVDAPIEL